MSGTAIAELDVYSGQPNPQWVLNEKSLAELRSYLAHLSPASSSGALPTGLGYRGIKVRGADSEPAWFMAVGEGHIFVNDLGKQIALVDAHRAVERWLLETGRAHIDPPLYQYLLLQILPAADSAPTLNSSE